jgi:hypothetical protein
MTKPGVYHHYKGGYYRVLFTAITSTNAQQGRPVVVYVSLTKGTIHVRDEEEFHELVNWAADEHPRFKWFGEDKQ